MPLFFEVPDYIENYLGCTKLLIIKHEHFEKTEIQLRFAPNQWHAYL
jgi:hypothetical protein